MRVVGLVSGGKDSCYNMMQCAAAGHEIVALANIEPSGKDELDSYMYQTVGHQGVSLIAEAMRLPLFRRYTKGDAVEKGRVYDETENDEVEDLYELLKMVKENIHVEGVSVGAILSDYQRIRVENVCGRLGLVSLAYLWQRDQAELLHEMINCKVNAIVIKVAALGLEPSILGKPIHGLRSHLLNVKEKFGVNVCGEGGEYETFTLDSPLYKSAIVVDETQVVVQSNDPIAPAGYMNLLKLHLEPKNENDSMYTCKWRTPYDFVSDITDSANDHCDDGDHYDLFSNEKASLLNSGKNDDSRPDKYDTDEKSNGSESRQNVYRSSPVEYETEKKNIEDNGRICINKSGWCWIGGIVGDGGPDVAMENALNKLCNILRPHDLTLKDVCAITLYIKDMGKYATLNESYVKILNFTNPPARVCVECPLPEGIGVILEALAFKNMDDENATDQDVQKYTMHVQGISHWAPANIGPYSQAVRIGDIINIAGQIPLIPGNMKLIEGNKSVQCHLALRHVQRILKAVDSKLQLRDVVQAICYVNHPCLITEARLQWEKHTNNAIVDYIVVPKLPRDAPIEWHVWAHRHNSRFECTHEETGCNVNEYTVSLTRRWNYDNNVSAVLCHIATAATPSTARMILENDVIAKHESLATSLSVDDLVEVLKYSIRKLLGDHLAEQKDIAICLRISYTVNKSPDVDLIMDALKKVKMEFFENMVFTVIPVIYIQNVFTFLSISAIKH